VEPANPKSVHARSRRGLTFLETVAATAILAMIAATVLSGFNAMVGGQKRNQHRLGAAELANRLVLQYLDDQDALPSSTLPVEYGGERYRWLLRETSVALTPSRPEVAAEREAFSTLSLSRLKAVTVQVWLGEESGGSFSIEPGTPTATLTRLVDPTAIRNPDSIDNIIKNPESAAKFIQQFTGGANRTRPSGSQPAPRATPSQTPRPPSKPSPKGGK